MEHQLEEKEVTKAAKALLSYEKKMVAEKAAKSGKSLLFEPDAVISLLVTLKRLPKDVKVIPFIIPLDHSLFAHDTRSVCLLVKDPQREYKSLLKAKNIDMVDKVIGVKKLKANYKSHEAKRRLCAEFDVFLADDRIIPMLPGLLGKSFFKKKKVPFPVKVSSSKIGTSLKAALDSTQLFVGPGTCSAVRVARTTFSPEDVAANILASMRTIPQHIPGGWKNIQSLHIKTTDSVALPLYTSLPDSETEAVPTAPAPAVTKSSKEPHKIKGLKKRKVQRVKKHA